MSKHWMQFRVNLVQRQYIVIVIEEICIRNEKSIFYKEL